MGWDNLGGSVFFGLKRGLRVFSDWGGEFFSCFHTSLENIFNKCYKKGGFHEKQLNLHKYIKYELEGG